MINHTKKYRAMTEQASEHLRTNDTLTPSVKVNAFPLKVDGDERFVVRIGLSAVGKVRGEGTAVHNPVDDFDPIVGILLASARAYRDYAKGLKEAAYHLMMKNAEAQKVRLQEFRSAKVAHELWKDPDVIIMKAKAHQARLIAALDQGRVFYCPECKGHFANNGKGIQTCPHCKKGHARRYWHVHKLDEFKDEKEAENGEKGTVPSDPLPR